MKSTTPELHLVLALGADGLDVRYRLEPGGLAAGEVLAELPLAVAGIPTIAIRDDEFSASDELGELVLTCAIEDEVRRWAVARATVGAVEVRHPAPYRHVDRHTRPGDPPLDLRREGDGVTGTGQTFLALPPLSRSWRMTLEWPGASSFKAGTVGTTEALWDCHYMIGGSSERCGPVTTWWLTRPSFDVRAFTEGISRLHQIMATDLGRTEADQLQVFLRGNPYPGMSGAGFISSFVVGWDPESPVVGPRMDFHLAHELVHVWIRADDESGYDDVARFVDEAWFIEGVADYFASVLPFRHGLISRETFLDQINVAARLCYANPYRDYSLRQLSAEVKPFTDFCATRLPYGRGMFYLADLSTRLTTVTIEELVRATQPADWVDTVSAATGEDEAPHFAAMVQQPGGWPRPDVWGPDFEYFEDDAPLVEPGFHRDSFMTRRVIGLVAGGPAARAGFQEGDPLGDLPSYEDLVRGKPSRLTMTQTVKVPAWR